MTIVHMCQAADVSRATRYRRGNVSPRSDRDVDLRDDIQKMPPGSTVQDPETAELRPTAPDEIRFHLGLEAVIVHEFPST